MWKYLNECGRPILRKRIRYCRAHSVSPYSWLSTVMGALVYAIVNLNYHTDSQGKREREN